MHNRKCLYATKPCSIALMKYSSLLWTCQILTMPKFSIGLREFWRTIDMKRFTNLSIVPISFRILIIQRKLSEISCSLWSSKCISPQLDNQFIKVRSRHTPTPFVLYAVMETALGAIVLPGYFQNGKRSDMSIHIIIPCFNKQHSLTNRQLQVVECF